MTRPKSFETGCTELMRRFLVFIFWSVVFVAVGFFFVPPTVRPTVVSLATGIFHSDSSAAQRLPLLEIDNRGTPSPHSEITAQRNAIPADGWRTVYGELAPATPLEQAISFEMTIEQILEKWPQVSTGIKEDSLFGYRVPFVSGTAENDITGALTYFFGSDRVLYRIDFKGDTGDTRKLILHLAKTFQMRRQNSTEQGVYLFQTPDDAQAVGELRICPRTIIHDAHPHQRFELSLQMSRFFSDSIDP